MMAKSRKNLNLEAAAILIWLPEGQTLDLTTLKDAKIEPPPSPNPEPWWYLKDAIIYACTLIHEDRKLPWIKVDTEILNPDDIREMFAGMRRA